MSESPGDEVLRTAVPLLAPIWLLSMLTGVVFDESYWFGGSLVVLLFYKVCSAVHTLETVEEITVHTIEVVLLNLAIPLIATLSIVSSIFYPFASSSLNFLLIACVFPHFQLLYFHPLKFFPHPYQLLFGSVLFLLSAIFGMATLHDQGPVAIIPIALSGIYAVACVWMCIYDLRYELPFHALRIFFQVLSVLLAVGSYVCFFAYPGLLHAMITATIASSAIFFFLDYWEHMIREYPEQVRTDTLDKNCVNEAWNQVLSHLLPAAAVVCWGLLASLGTAGQLHTFVPAGYGVVMLHLAYSLLTNYKRAKEPPLVAQPMNMKTAFTIGHIVMIVVLKVAMACFYCLAPEASDIPTSLWMMATALLCLELTNLLDSIRAFLLPYNGKLSCYAFGSSLYAYASCFYVKYRELASAEGPIPTPCANVVLVTSLIFAILLVHFYAAIHAQEKKLNEPSSFAAAAKKVDSSSDSDGKCGLKKGSIV